MPRSTLRAWSSALAEQPRWLVLNKIDTIEPERRAAAAAHWAEQLGWTGAVHAISAATGEGVPELRQAIGAYFEAQRSANAAAAEHSGE